MARKKISTTVYFTEEQDASIREISHRTGIPMAILIRDGVQRTLDAYAEDGRTVLGRANRLAEEVPSCADPELINMAEELHRIIDHARSLQRERDEATERAFTARSHLQELQNRIGEMVSSPIAR